MKKEMQFNWKNVKGTKKNISIIISSFVARRAIGNNYENTVEK